MTAVRGTKTFQSVNGKDLSAFTDTSEFSRTGGAEDISGYGTDADVYGGTTTGGTLTISGKYDDGNVNGPSAVLDPLVGQETPVAWIRRREGTGTGKPQQSGLAVVTKYVETAPRSGYVAWAAELQLSGPVAKTVQP